MKTSTSKVSKGKGIKHSIPGIGRLTSPEHQVSRYLRHQPALRIMVLKDANALTNSPLHVPIVLVLWSPRHL